MIGKERKTERRKEQRVPFKKVMDSFGLNQIFPFITFNQEDYKIFPFTTAR